MEEGAGFWGEEGVMGGNIFTRKSVSDLYTRLRNTVLWACCFIGDQHKFFFTEGIEITFIEGFEGYFFAFFVPLFF